MRSESTSADRTIFAPDFIVQEESVPARFISIENESGAPYDCFPLNICSEKQKVARSFYGLRKAKNFLMTVSFMYNFRSLSNEFTFHFAS